ncbi:MAG: glycosyl hydrolase family 28-related protein [Balneolaceae bacterium]
MFKKLYSYYNPGVLFQLFSLRPHTASGCRHRHPDRAGSAKESARFRLGFSPGHRGKYLVFLLLLCLSAACTTVHKQQAESTGSTAGAVSVLDFGAVGDGETDNTGAFQQAVSHAGNKGVPLYIPPGRYLIRSHITVEAPVQIQGAGHLESVLTSNGENARLMLRHGGIAIRDMGFEHMVEPIALDTGEGYALDNIRIERSRFENIEATTTNRGVIGLSDGDLWQRQYPVKSLLVRDCIFRDINPNAINIRANISHAQILNNRFLNIVNPRQNEEGDGPLGGFAVRLGESADDAGMLDEFRSQGNHRILGNEVTHMRKYTTRGNLKGFLIYGDYNVIGDNLLEDIDGTIFGDDTNAMYIRGAYNRILSNTVRHIHGADDDGAVSFKGGVSRGSQHNLISQNTIQHIRGMSAVEVSSSHVQVIENVIEDAPVRGFFHRTGKDLWLVNNTFTDANADIRTGRRQGEGEAFISGNRFLNSELQLSQFRRDLHIVPRNAVYIQGNLFRNTRTGPDVRMIRMASNVVESFVSIRNNRFHNLAGETTGQASGRMVDLETAGRVQDVEIVGNHIIQKGSHSTLFHIGNAAGSGRFTDNTFIIHDLRGPVLDGAFTTIENNTVRIAEDASEQLSVRELFVLRGYSPEAPMVFRNNRLINRAAHVQVDAVTRWEDDFSRGNGPELTNNTIDGRFTTLGSFNATSVPDVRADNNRRSGGAETGFAARKTDDPADAVFPGEGSGTRSDPYRITTANELQEMRTDLSAHYILANDIPAGETRDWNNGAGFEPIGGSTGGFEGSLDGSGHTVSGLVINRPDSRYVGLFGKMASGGTVTMLGLDDADITGYYAVGTLAGINEGGSISGSFARCRIRGRHDIGGLIGLNDRGIVTDSYAECDVTANSDAGGLIGFSSGSVRNSYSAGSVEAVARAFGLVGYQAVWNDDSVITGSFWDVDLYMHPDLWSPGKTTAEMKNIETFSGAAEGELTGRWDIAPLHSHNGETWKIDSGKDYPRLGWE